MAQSRVTRGEYVRTFEKEAMRFGGARRLSKVLGGEFGWRLGPWD